MKIQELASFFIFLASATFYVITMFIHLDISEFITILICWIAPVIGIVLGFRSNQTLRYIGIFGNTMVLLIAAIIPAISILFWNNP